MAKTRKSLTNTQRAAAAAKEKQAMTRVAIGGLSVVLTLVGVIVLASIAVTSSQTGKTEISALRGKLSLKVDHPPTAGFEIFGGKNVSFNDIDIQGVDKAITQYDSENVSWSNVKISK
jgi:hypothetical protein